MPAQVVQVEIVVRLDVEALDLVATDVALGRDDITRTGSGYDRAQRVAMTNPQFARGARSVERGAVAFKIVCTASP